MTKEKLRKRVIELIHDLPYEEAVKRELIVGCTLIVGFKERTVLDFRSDGTPITSLYGGIASQGTYKIIGLPITIGRVMRAFKSVISKTNDQMVFNDTDTLLSVIMNWKLTKENGQECTLEDQSEKTIEKLWKLLKN